MASLRVVSPYHTVSYYRRAYAMPIVPIANEEDWNEPAYKVIAPVGHRRPGRPKKTRRIDAEEREEMQAKKRKCKRCGAKGHYARSCGGIPKKARAQSQAKHNTTPSTTQPTLRRYQQTKKTIDLNEEPTSTNTARRVIDLTDSPAKNTRSSKNPVIELRDSPAKKPRSSKNPVFDLRDSPAKNTRSANRCATDGGATRDFKPCKRVLDLNASPSKNINVSRDRGNEPTQSSQFTSGANAYKVPTQSSQVRSCGNAPEKPNHVKKLLANFERQFGKRKLKLGFGKRKLQFQGGPSTQ